MRCNKSEARSFSWYLCAISNNFPTHTLSGVEYRPVYKYSTITFAISGVVFKFIFPQNTYASLCDGLDLFLVFLPNFLSSFGMIFILKVLYSFRGSSWKVAFVKECEKERKEKTTLRTQKKCKLLVGQHSKRKMSFVVFVKSDCVD